MGPLSVLCAPPDSKARTLLAQCMCQVCCCVLLLGLVAVSVLPGVRWDSCSYWGKGLGVMGLGFAQL